MNISEKVKQKQDEIICLLLLVPGLNGPQADAIEDRIRGLEEEIKSLKKILSTNN